MAKFIPVVSLDLTIDLADRPGNWQILPESYSPFQNQSTDGTKIYVPFINTKDKNGKPEGTISVLELSVVS